jgi:hypothetical protein
VSAHRYQGSILSGPHDVAAKPHFANIPIEIPIFIFPV